MAVDFKLRGAKEMQRKMESLAKRFPDRIKNALQIEAEKIATRSKNEFVPVDLGTLRSSIHVEEPIRKGKDIEVTIAAGGAAAPYALTVHEYPSDYDPPSWKGGEVEFSPPGRGPKYIERPLKQAIKGMSNRIAESLDLDKNR